ncbi:GNAT family N-acetyltransferase [Streptomyces clavifer]|uniref:GNAT family N-acetyltransferase n=1 Tax=Streptomyces clavifer TaxID=68188 RepID=UPI002E8093AE|nr:GNAT family N-acetyltransferase [Streptomyces clavifer]WUC30918.1 GNAT family N-acetyltransferase [Streptomyces clavifer]
MTTRPSPADAPGVRVRDMEPGDCDAVAEIRVRGWQAAYAGLVPQAYLDAMDVAREAELRRRTFAAGGPQVHAVSLAADSAVTGWACYGPCRDAGAPSGRGELYALYVHPERIGTGAGRALLSELTARAATAGFHEMALWVLRDNTRARRFYERAGFLPDGAEESSETGGAAVPEVRYVRTLSGPAAG